MIYTIIISSQFKHHILFESFLPAKVSYLLPIPAPPLGLSYVFGKVSTTNTFQTLVSLEVNFLKPIFQNIAIMNSSLEILIDSVHFRWHLKTISRTWFWSGHILTNVGPIAFSVAMLPLLRGYDLTLSGCLNKAMKGEGRMDMGK